MTSSYDVVVADVDVLACLLTWSDDISRGSSARASITSSWGQQRESKRHMRACAVSDEGHIFMRHRLAYSKAYTMACVVDG